LLVKSSDDYRAPLTTFATALLTNYDLARDDSFDTTKNHTNASSKSALPIITIHNQPPYAYTGLATEEPNAPSMKMLLMYSAFRRLRLLESRGVDRTLADDHVHLYAEVEHPTGRRQADNAVGRMYECRQEAQASEQQGQ
jgi:hypothetical protein